MKKLLVSTLIAVCIIAGVPSMTALPALAEEEAERYQLSVQMIDEDTDAESSLCGTVTGTGTYQEGDAVVLTAVPADGYELSVWQVPYILNEKYVLGGGTISFSMPAEEVNITVKFRKHVHEFYYTMSNDTEHWVGCFCGQEEAGSRAAHSFVVLGVSDTEHWYQCEWCETEQEGSRVSHGGGTATCTEQAICSVCETEYGELLPHTYTIKKKNEKKHWKICTCGAVKEGSETKHSYEMASNEKKHWKECACGVVKEGSKEKHSYVMVHDETKHWKACACGRVKDGSKEKHADQTWRNDAEHWSGCACGYQQPGTQHVFEWKMADVAHWKECACGYQQLGTWESHSYTNRWDTECEEGCGYKRTSIYTSGYSDVYGFENFGMTDIDTSVFQGEIVYCLMNEYLYGMEQDKFDPFSFATGYDVLAGILRVMRYEGVELTSDQRETYTGEGWQKKAEEDAQTYGMLYGVRSDLAEPAMYKDVLQILFNIISAGQSEQTAAEFLQNTGLFSDKINPESGDEYVIREELAGILVRLEQYLAGEEMKGSMSGGQMINSGLEEEVDLFTEYHGEVILPDTGTGEDAGTGADADAGSDAGTGADAMQKLSVVSAQAGNEVLIQIRTDIAKAVINVQTGNTGNSGDNEENKDNENNDSGTPVSMLPDTILIRPRITSGITGEEMNAALAEEVSAEPQILAGYPRAGTTNPTSANILFRANKKGTISWVLTALADGSVGQEEVIHPPAYGNRILQHGTVTVDDSGMEYTVALENLVSDGSYYVSAVLTDNREEHSTVKVMTFTTPDASVPGFSDGYPTAKALDTEKAEITFMAEKDCKLYWAVDPSGSAALTAEELRTGKIPVLQKDSAEMINNVPMTVVVENLEPDRDYIMCAVLFDNDWTKHSEVKMIGFTTPREENQPGTLTEYGDGAGCIEILVPNGALGDGSDLEETDVIIGTEIAGVLYDGSKLVQLKESGEDLHMRIGFSGILMQKAFGEDSDSGEAGASEEGRRNLDEELIEMITTQRGYQANTRMITVTDSMLEELINMKR